MKTKAINMVAIRHPKLAIFGIGLAITFVVGAVIGMIESTSVSWSWLS
jgi:hypothetical protein